MNLRSGISILSMVLLVTLASCSGDDGPADDIVITGNSELLDFFEEFNPPRRGARADEQRSSGYNSKFFTDSLDFNKDGIYDLKTWYFIERRISGDSTVVTRIGPMHENAFIMGDTVRFGGVDYWVPRIFVEGETATADTGLWETINLNVDLYLFDYWRKVAGSGSSVDMLSEFPEDREGYVIFKVYNNGQTLIGWLKLRLALPGRFPEIEQMGYRLVDTN